MADQSGSQHSRGGSSSNQTKWLIVGGIIALLLVAAILLVLVLTTQKDNQPTAAATPPPAGPTPTVTVTITVPAPSATISPSPRQEGTDFYNALPSVVRDYVLVATAPDDGLEDAGALEAYALTYTNGTNTITLRAGQWRTDGLAGEALAELGGAASSDTEVTWANQTAVFQAKATPGGAVSFEAGFPY
ncbi:MAG: hypothetical protein LBR19_07835 [Bifidobacteriaceae bacterium]|nr:hypothetical protein [Bifidobacteriaceae bacterium]